MSDTNKEKELEAKIEWLGQDIKMYEAATKLCGETIKCLERDVERLQHEVERLQGIISHNVIL